MKPIYDTVQRLLNAAAKAPSEVPTTPPLGLETRVLAHWRAGTADDDLASLFAFFRHAMVGAGLVLVLSAVWSLSQPAGSAAGDEAALLNYEHPEEPEPMTSLGKWKLGFYVLAIFLAGGGSGALIAWRAWQGRAAMPLCARRRSGRGCAPSSSPGST